MLRILLTAAVGVLSGLGVLGAPPAASADPGGSPVCDPNPPTPGFEPVVAPCDPVGRALDGSLVTLPGLPRCDIPYELLQDIAAVGGYSWYCVHNYGWPSRNLRDPLPYCAAPLVLVPDAIALGGQRWQCLVAVGSGPAPPPRSDDPPAEVGSGPAPPWSTPPPPPPPPGG